MSDRERVFGDQILPRPKHPAGTATRLKTQRSRGWRSRATPTASPNGPRATLAWKAPGARLKYQVDQRQARSPQAAHKPRVHWFIGLSERTRDDPPVGASHTGRKEKRKTRHGPEGHVSRSRCLVSALMTVERETRISQIRHSRKPSWSEADGAAPRPRSRPARSKGINNWVGTPQFGEESNKV